MDGRGRRGKKSTHHCAKSHRDRPTLRLLYEIEREAVEAYDCCVTRAARDLDPFEIRVRSADYTFRHTYVTNLMKSRERLGCRGITASHSLLVFRAFRPKRAVCARRLN